MGKTTKQNYGRASFNVKSNTVDACVSVESGMMTASFKDGENEIFPYFVSPWWNEGNTAELPRIMANMRGDYFCLPFGINAKPVNGIQHPLHGETANECWDFESLDEKDGEHTLSLTVPFAPEKGQIRKQITLKDDEPIIYTSHTVSGFTGKTSIGHHPNLQCSDVKGCAILDFSEPLTGFTDSAPLDVPANHYYSYFKPAAQFNKLSEVPSNFGDTIDMTRYPHEKGYNDVLILISDPEKEFVFTSLTETEKGFLYFQLKNPKDLASTLLWMPNGGQHEFPWNGRVDSVIGMEEITGNYYQGMAESVESNFIKDKGYKTYLEFSEDQDREIKLISGTIAVDKSFKGVKDIIRKNDKEITIIGRGGENIDVPCSIDFLKESVS